MNPTPYAVCVATSEQDAEKLQDFMREQMGHTMPAPKPTKCQCRKVDHFVRPKYVHVVWNSTNGEIMGIYWNQIDAEEHAEKLTENTFFVNFEVCAYEVK